MKKKDYTELDKLFQSRMSRKAERDSWNSPSDRVLSNSLEAVNKNKRKRWPFYFLGCGLLIIGVLCFVVFSNYGKIQSLESELRESKAANSHFVEKNDKDTEVSTSTIAIPEEMESAIVMEKKALTTEKEEDRISIPTQEIAPVVIQKNNNTHIQNYPTSTRENTFTNGENKSIAINVEGRQENLNELYGVATPERKAIAQLDYLNLPTLSNLMIDQRNVSISDKVFRPEESNSKWEFYLLAGINSSSMKMKDLPNVNYSLTGYDNYFMGYQVGVGSRLFVNDNWGIGLQATAERRNNKSTFEDQMIFDQSNVTDDGNGELFYSSSMELASPTSSFETQLRMNVTEHGLAQNDVMENKATNDQAFHIVSVGLHPFYRLNFTDRISLTSSLGPQINYLFKYNNKMAVDLLHNNAIIDSKVMEDTDKSSLHSLNLVLQGNLDLNYEFNKRWVASVNLGLMRSITSLRNDPSSPTKTFFKDFSFGSTVGMKF